MRASSPVPGEKASTARLLTLPNVLSGLRLASVPFIVWLFVTGRPNAAVVLYAVGAWTDFFDGYLARRMGSVSELGKLLDPFADRVFIIALTVALIARGALSAWLAVVVVARDVLLLSAFFLMDRRGMERISVNFVGKLATAALLLGLTLVAFSETTLPLVESPVSATLGIWLTIGGAILYWVSGGLYAREALGQLRPGKDGGAGS